MASATSRYPVITPEEVQSFKDTGYIVLKGFLSPDEVAGLAGVYERLMSAELPVPGKDHGEHTPGLLNVTAFSRYHPFCGLPPLNDIDQRCLAVVRQLYGDESDVFMRDYEQLLRKLPARPTAAFPPHQDMHYWPKTSPGSEVKFDTRTATCSIAVNEASRENGCLWVLPGSHKAGELYPGCLSKAEGSRPVAGGVIQLEVLPEDVPRRVFLPLTPGDMSIHEEWIVHGSEGNASAAAARDTLILAYRSRAMVAFERSVGFSHSYNDREEDLVRVREGRW